MFLAPAAGWSQQAGGAVTGTVTDASGAPIAGAAVTARNTASGAIWNTATNATGTYDFPHVAVGNVSVTVKAHGFSTQVQPAFNLVLNQVARVNFKLQVGAVTQTVEVSSAPPLLQTDSTAVGTVIGAQAVSTLPLATRNLNQLTLLTPGVTSPNIFAFQSPQTTFGTGRPYVNGAREQDNNFSLDGMDINQPDNNDVAYVPNVDAVQEFNLIAGNAPADFGNYLGGVVVETLKSGTDKYHGEVFEFLRNTSLNANSWQNNVTGNPRNPLQWNEFGGTFGGPIVHNKLFFFGDFQASLFNTPANTVLFSPITTADRAGDFRSLCTAGFNAAGVCADASEQLYQPAAGVAPGSRQPFPFNKVPISSKVAQAILGSSFLPAPTQTSFTTHNYVNSYQGDVKVDWQPTERDHVFGRYSQMHTLNNTTNSIALIPNLTRVYPLKNFVVDYTHELSANAVNDARFGMQLFPADDQQFTNATNQNFPALFGIPGVQDSILPALNFGGTPASIGNADLVEIFHDNTLEAEDTLTMTYGNHVIDTGFEAYHYTMNDLYPGNQGVAGQFTFTGQFTSNLAAGTSGPSPFADFLLGLPGTVQEGTPFQFQLRNSLFGAFVQDNWHATNNLTLNLGLRWEVTTPRGDATRSHNVNFDLITGTPEIGTNYNTYNGAANFQPRLGFAWQPGFAAHTVVRGAYGISTYMEGNGLNNMAVVNPPNIVARTEINNGLDLPATTLDQGYAAFPAAACTAAALQAFSPNCLAGGVTVHETNPNLRPAVDQQWNFTIQRQFGNHTTVSAAYVGNHVTHMSDIVLWNQKQLVNGQLVPGPFSQPLVATGASVRYNDSTAIQKYNALELTAEMRPTSGLSLQAGYTFSKCLSNSLGYFGQFGDEEGIGQSQTAGGYFFFQNNYAPGNDVGRCISDVASQFSGYAVYDLPFGKGRHFAGGAGGILNGFIGGWELATDFNFHTGFAINPAAPDQSLTGSVGGAYRPNCVPGVSQHGSGQFENVGGSLGLQFLNPQAVSLPATGTFGNCPVGAFRGPGLATADMNLSKNFAVTERTNLKFMVQALNVTNTPIFGAPSSSCGPSCDGIIASGSNHAGTFGVVQSQDPGRQIQFGLRLSF